MLHARLQSALAATAGHAGGEDEAHFGAPDGGHRPAAVLVPFTDRAEPGVILTQRPQWLRSHAGQVAFPGGKVDAGDADVVAAALREADEELGLSPDAVRIAGIANDYHSGSGYRITPVLGVIAPDLAFDPNPDEVEAWFEVPMAHLFDVDRYVRREALWKGQQRSYYDMEWNGRRIWGVTAGIIINLARRLQL
jgi:8-oxo-dGTP pyrophosphatase MutT (NUDIX family)